MFLFYCFVLTVYCLVNIKGELCEMLFETVESTEGETASVFTTVSPIHCSTRQALTYLHLFYFNWFRYNPFRWVKHVLCSFWVMYHMTHSESHFSPGLSGNPSLDDGKATRVFPILYKIRWISWIRWIQLESVKHNWRLLKAFLCLSLTVGSCGIVVKTPDWESVGCDFKYRNCRLFLKESLV